MPTITFKYRSGATTYSRTYDAYAIRGLDEPDDVELWPPIQHRLSDGSIREQIVGFRRIITATLGVLQVEADRTFALNFLQSKERWVYLGSLASVYCVLDDPAGFENQWLHDTSLLRFFEVRLKEWRIYTTWPDELEPTADTNLYIKTNVQITGNEASPQTLTTNTAPLDVDDTGNPYPAINLAAYAVSVVLAERQDCLINRIADITQAGSNITFTVAHSDAGNPYADGNYYATVTILLQAK